jgi:hypothetical protein
MTCIYCLHETGNAPNCRICGLTTDPDRRSGLWIGICFVGIYLLVFGAAFLLVFGTLASHNSTIAGDRSTETAPPDRQEVPDSTIHTSVRQEAVSTEDARSEQDTHATQPTVEPTTLSGDAGQQTWSRVEATKQAPVLTTTVQSVASLLDLYTEDKRAADARYKGKLISVAGKVVKVGSGSVEVSNESAKPAVNCHFDSREDVRNVSVGQQIVVEGLVKGRRIFNNDVTFENCHLVIH